MQRTACKARSFLYLCTIIFVCLSSLRIGYRIGMVSALEKAIRANLSCSETNMSALQRHILHFCPFGCQLSSEEIEAIHRRMGMNSIRMMIKSDVITGLANDIQSLSCVFNPSATGLWKYETGELDEARWNLLSRMTINDTYGDRWVLRPHLEALRRNYNNAILHPYHRWALDQNTGKGKCEYTEGKRSSPQPNFPITWEMVTNNSLSELFGEFAQHHILISGDLVPAWRFEDLRSFYQDSRPFFLSRENGWRPTVKLQDSAFRQKTDL